jgi:hypothetical protein
MPGNDALARTDPVHDGEVMRDNGAGRVPALGTSLPRDK